MADDSWEVPTEMDFHPCHPPIGMKDYVLEDLTPGQQEQLNAMLLNDRRNNETYLASHPEIRAIIALILRMVLQTRPKNNIHSYIASFFLRPTSEIRDEIDKYLAKRQKVISTSSLVIIRKEPSSTVVCPTPAPSRTVSNYIRDLLDSRLDEALEASDAGWPEDVESEWPASKSVLLQGAQDDLEDPMLLYRFCRQTVGLIVKKAYESTADGMPSTLAKELAEAYHSPHSRTESLAQDHSLEDMVTAEGTPRECSSYATIGSL